VGTTGSLTRSLVRRCCDSREQANLVVTEWRRIMLEILKLIGSMLDKLSKGSEGSDNPWWPRESMQPRLVLGKDSVVVGRGFLKHGGRHEIPITHHLYPGGDYWLTAIAQSPTGRFLVEVPGVGKGSFRTLTLLDGVEVDKGELMLKEISGWTVPGLRDSARCVEVPSLDCTLSITGADPPAEEQAGGGRMYRGHRYIAHITCVFGEGHYHLTLQSNPRATTFRPEDNPAFPWNSPNWPAV